MASSATLVRLLMLVSLALLAACKRRTPPAQGTGASRTTQSSRPSGAAPRAEAADTCALATAMQRELRTYRDVIDCGSLRAADPASAWQRAHACVEQSRASGSAFRVSFPEPGYDSLENVGIVSDGAQGSIVMFRRSSAPRAPFQLQVSLRAATCRRLSVRSGCRVRAGDLCLACEGSSPWREICGREEPL